MAEFIVNYFPLSGQRENDAKIFILIGTAIALSALKIYSFCCCKQAGEMVECGHENERKMDGDSRWGNHWQTISTALRG